MVLGGQLPGRVDGRRNPISFFMSNLLWWVWRSWLARQIVALEAVGSNPTIHPFYGSLAQLVEHFIRNEKVPGSSPGRGSGKEIQLTFQIVESLFFLYKSLEIIIYSFYD